ncbi:DUF1156 domain-containing protein [Hymenobacter arizonensis]|uniref:Putative DNA methylase n=1 Tax=Hymenobacter arizonensis TaxID=1227077 RepID=A0A1I5YXV6_HYMAR|nr:DUF1156 domain-containing protein [Hymenobacter arizonensis]SFQ49103.1 putative DNA methylase [Hymenobacter arizonensis]
MTKKLIETSIPLDIINDESAYDKMPGIGAHPKGLHHWWARLPLPAARAVLFASIVDDPSARPDEFPTPEACQEERDRLFGIIRRLCQKKIHLHQEAFREANAEIKRQCGNDLPTVLDPFAGGGSIPLEAMRLGLPALATDLNPVAVLINKVALEILPRWANQPPLNPDSAQRPGAPKQWHRARGMAEDLRYYGRRINEEVKRRIGQHYPKARVGNKEYNVITWLWARTVRCPNPVCSCQMPLVRSFVLSTKRSPRPYSEPIIERSANGNTITGYVVKYGEPAVKSTIARRGATCIACGQFMPLKDIRQFGLDNNGFQSQLLALVTDVGSGNGKQYLSPNKEQEQIAASVPNSWEPDVDLPDSPRWFSPPLYGLTTYAQLFTKRQLLSLNTLNEAITSVITELKNSGAPSEYCKALHFAFTVTINRLADFNCSLSSWKSSGEQQMHLFTRQAIPMVWDYTEANILEPKAISWLNAIDITAESIETVLSDISTAQNAKQQNAATHEFAQPTYLISTDPPYYDNIGYSDLSDFFYVWLRHGLQEQYPDLLRTVLVPKMEELVAAEARYGGKAAAKEHFETGFRAAFGAFRKGMDPRFPLTVYYAFKQSEDADADNSPKIGDDLFAEEAVTLTTGWETLLAGLVTSGFQITATWPVKASQKWRMVAMGTNALTSYIVLACRPRPEDAPTATRREFAQRLRRELPAAIEILQASNLAPVDLAQAAIGPGIAIFSRYAQVLEQSGKPMRMKTALALVNQALAEVLVEQEGDFDAETRWALAWYADHQFESGDFGKANQLAGSKNTAVNALTQTGIVRSGGGRVKLLAREELAADWDPTHDSRTVVWEITQHLIKRLQAKGEEGAARLYRLLDGRASAARELAYGLFTLCERKGWSQEALAYNSLVLAWNGILAQSQQLPKAEAGEQGRLDL